MRHIAILLENYGAAMQLAIQQLRSRPVFLEKGIVFGEMKFLNTLTVVVHGEAERPMFPGKLVEYEGGRMNGLIEKGAWPFSAKKVMEMIREKAGNSQSPRLRVASLVPDY